MRRWACAASAFLSRKKTKRRRSCREKETHYSSDGLLRNLIRIPEAPIEIWKKNELWLLGFLSWLCFVTQSKLYVAKSSEALGPSRPWDTGSLLFFSLCGGDFCLAGRSGTVTAAIRLPFSLLLLGGQKIYAKGEVGSGPRKPHYAGTEWFPWHPGADCWKGVNRSQGSVADTWVSAQPDTSAWREAASWPSAFRGMWGISRLNALTLPTCASATFTPSSEVSFTFCTQI